MAWHAGIRVMLTGLTSRAELNGSTGVVEQEMDKGRIQVYVDANCATKVRSQIIAVRPANLVINQSDEDSTSDSASSARVTPDNFAQRLSRARPGELLQLRPGVYRGSFKVTQDVHLMGAPGVVLESSDVDATLMVHSSGQVTLSDLDVRNRRQESGTHHALFVTCGAVDATHCTFTSQGGPSVAVVSRVSTLSLSQCDVSFGAHGGLLVGQDAAVRAVGLRSTNNAASGIEVRERGELRITDSLVSENGKIGMVVWCGAKSVRAENCRFTRHANESAVLCGDGELEMHDCVLCDNLRGIAIQGGHATLKECKVKGNGTEGILIQSKGSARVEHSEVCDSGANGIFVGYDTSRRCVIKNNNVHSNRMSGIFNGVPNSKKITIANNQQSKNSGLPPKPETIHKLLQSMNAVNQNSADDDERTTFSKPQNLLNVNGPRGAEHTKWAKQMNKEGVVDSIVQAHLQDKTCGPFLSREGTGVGDALNEMLNQEIAAIRKCWKCGAQERRPKKLLMCGRCHVALYCSKECQRAAWKGGHKGECKAHVEFPAFADNSKSILETEGAREGNLEDEFTSIERGVQAQDVQSILAKAHMLLEATEYSEAYQLVSTPAEQGNAEAQRMLGYLHEKGLGCDRDFRKAKSWYLCSAQQGSAAAMACLGNLHRAYNITDSVAEDNRCAQDWWKKARATDRDVGKLVKELPEITPPCEAEADASAASEAKAVLQRMFEGDLSAVFQKEPLASTTSKSVDGALNEKAALQFLQSIVVNSKSSVTPSGTVDVHERVSRMHTMAQAVDEDIHHTMLECRNYMNACVAFLDFQAVVEKEGVSDTALITLYNSFYLDEKAAMWEVEQRQKVFEHAKLMTVSNNTAIRHIGLFIASNLTNPVDAAPYLFKLNRELAGSDARVLEYLALVHGFMKKWKDLIFYAQQALDVNPDMYHAHYHIAAAHYQEGNKACAIAHFTKYLDACPVDSRKIVNAHYTMAVCHLGLGQDVSKALRCYEAGLTDEKRLEAFWGSYANNHDKRFLETLNLSNKRAVQRFMKRFDNSL